MEESDFQAFLSSFPRKFFYFTVHPCPTKEISINEKNLWKKHVWSGHERPHPKIRMRSLWFIACVTRQCWMIMDGVKRQLPTQQMWFERSTLYSKGEKGGEPSKPATVTLKRYVGHPPHDGWTDRRIDRNLPSRSFVPSHAILLFLRWFRIGPHKLLLNIHRW